MDIKTKLSIGDSCYYTTDEGVKKGIITDIQIKISKNDSNSILYGIEVLNIGTGRSSVTLFRPEVSVWGSVKEVAESVNS